MAFASTVTYRKIIEGNRVHVYGAWTEATGDTGGDITTGLEMVEYFECHSLSDTATVCECGINETLPIASEITIVTQAGPIAGLWHAIGPS